MFDTILLLAGAAEQSILPLALRGHNPLLTVINLALQLPFCFEMRALSGGLVSSAPERPCDDVCGLDALSREPDGNAADFLY